MIFVSSGEREYTLAILQADAVPAVRTVMDDWYKTARQNDDMPVTLVVDAYMQAHEREKALQSLVRAYGRASRPHRFMFQMLETAIRQTQALVEYGVPGDSGPLPGLMTPDMGRMFGR